MDWATQTHEYDVIKNHAIIALDAGLASLSNFNWNLRLHISFCSTKQVFFTGTPFILIFTS